MCAIGRNLDTSVGANAPSTTMLGTSAVGSTPAAGRRGRTIGTLLTGQQTTGSGTPTVTGPGSRTPNPRRQPF